MKTTMLGDNEKKILHFHLQKAGIKENIQSISTVGGGCINNCYAIQFHTNEKVFLKTNINEAKDNFEKEKFNLNYLKGKSSLRIPEVIALFEECDKVYLVLEYLERTVEDDAFFLVYGKGLAELHKNTTSFFGWYHDNYIGSLVQQNNQRSTWSEFYITQRLDPLVKECYDKKMLDKISIRSFQNLYNRLEDIYPNEPSALLHGDLWQGNRMPVKEGAAVFDAACYYGHREMDIAMNLLFGHLPSSFFDAYNSVYPLEKSFMQRKDISQLYPLLVHAVLFGMSYIYDIKSIIKKF